MNRIVDFVIGGTQKGGTTALYRYLRAHPDICMTRDEDFLNAVRNEPLQARHALPLQDRQHSFIDRGLYSDQLRRVWFFFPKKQTLILKWEDFKAGQNESLEEICRFLGVEAPSGLSASRPPAPAYAPMETRHREYLAKVYENEIREVERLLDWDGSDWNFGTAV